MSAYEVGLLNGKFKAAQEPPTPSPTRCSNNRQTEAVLMQAFSEKRRGRIGAYADCVGSQKVDRATEAELRTVYVDAVKANSIWNVYGVISGVVIAALA